MIRKASEQGDSQDSIKLLAGEFLEALGTIAHGGGDRELSFKRTFKPLIFARLALAQERNLQ